MALDAAIKRCLKITGKTPEWRTFAFHEALEEGKKLGKAPSKQYSLIEYE